MGSIWINNLFYKNILCYFTRLWGNKISICSNSNFFINLSRIIFTSEVVVWFKRDNVYKVHNSVQYMLGNLINIILYFIFLFLFLPLHFYIIHKIISTRKQKFKNTFYDLSKVNVIHFNIWCNIHLDKVENRYTFCLNPWSIAQITLVKTCIYLSFTV